MLPCSSCCSSWKMVSVPHARVQKGPASAKGDAVGAHVVHRMVWVDISRGSTHVHGWHTVHVGGARGAETLTWVAKVAIVISKAWIWPWCKACPWVEDWARCRVEGGLTHVQTLQAVCVVSRTHPDQVCIISITGKWEPQLSKAIKVPSHGH